MRILSIDDAKFIRSKIRNTVIEMDHDFLEAENGSEALQLLDKTGMVDLILLDYNMPVMDGIETLKRLKADSRFCMIPVVMVTTEIEKTKVIDALQNGAVDYVMKPFEDEDLVQKISRHLPQCG